MNDHGDWAFNATKLTGNGHELTYAGALSFLRRKYTRDIAGADVVVSGIPFDCAVTNRPGARLGPRAIREASTQLQELKSFPHGIDPFENLAIADAGDCYLNPHYPLSVADTIEAHCKWIIAAGAKPLSLGGDHFVAYPLIKAVAAHHGPIALLQFDAHCDTWSMTGEGAGREIDHGTMKV